MTRIPRLATASAAAVVVALAVSACGTTDTEQAQEQEPSAAPVSQECAEDTTATSTGPVSMTDGLGRTVELERPAERVAVLEWQQIEDALSLCVAPVAVSDVEGYTTYVTAEDLPEGTTDVGLRQEPDLDTLYASDPDLIIVEAVSADDEVLAQLEERDVPVLATVGADPEDPIGNMKDVFSMIAEATGREERGDQVLQDFDQHLADAKQQVEGTDMATDEFVYFDGWVDAGNLTIRPYGEGALFTALGEELGMRTAWTEDIEASYGDGGVVPAYGLSSTDLEGLTAVGDANLFYANDEAAEGGYVEALESNPLWTSMPAVQEGRAHAFPPSIWGAGGPKSNEQAIDAYVEILTQD